MTPVFLDYSLAYVQAFEIFGIDILTAPRNQITEVLKFDQLKLNLIEKYGKPAEPSVKDRNSDYEEELLWKKNRVGTRMQTMSF